MESGTRASVKRRSSRYFFWDLSGSKAPELLGLPFWIIETKQEAERNLRKDVGLRSACCRTHWSAPLHASVACVAGPRLDAIPCTKSRILFYIVTAAMSIEPHFHQQ
jgi:hypothetical protein